MINTKTNQQMKIQTIIIGLDLSFNSTGITISMLDENNIGQRMQFHRIVFNDNPSRPKKLPPLSTINQHQYTMPSNFDYRKLSVLDTLFDDYSTEWLSNGNVDSNNKWQESIDYEYYGIDQLFISTKLMTNASVIFNIINDVLTQVTNEFNTNNINVIFNMEGNILTNNGVEGKHQLRVTGGLMYLQQEIRSRIIRMAIDDNYKSVKLFVTSPTENKMFFTDNGKATKLDMVKSFVDDWDGKKLIPETSMVDAINDVVDSFALMMIGFHKFIMPDDYINWLKLRSPSRGKKKQPKKKKPKKEISDISLDSIYAIDLIQTN